jgi:hypothetical protein
MESSVLMTFHWYLILWNAGILYRGEVVSYGVEYPPSNQSFISFLIGFICEMYSIHGLGEHQEIESEYDLRKYVKYPYPALEFACHYLDYLYNQEGTGVTDPFTGEPLGPRIKNSLSFRILENHRSSLIALTKRLNVSIDFLKERIDADIVQVFVDVLLSNDLTTLDKERYRIYFNCQTRTAVYVFYNLKEVYTPRNFETVVDRSDLFFSKQAVKITKSSLYKENNKLKTDDYLDSHQRLVIDKIFKDCSPFNFNK